MPCRSLLYWMKEGPPGIVPFPTPLGLEQLRKPPCPSLIPSPRAPARQPLAPALVYPSGNSVSSRDKKLRRVGPFFPPQPATSSASVRLFLELFNLPPQINRGGSCTFVFFKRPRQTEGTSTYFDIPCKNFRSAGLRVFCPPPPPPCCENVPFLGPPLSRSSPAGGMALFPPSPQPLPRPGHQALRPHLLPRPSDLFGGLVINSPKSSLWPLHFFYSTRCGPPLNLEVPLWGL